MTEAIADKIQAINNITNSNLLIIQKHLTKIMKKLEDKLDEKFGIFMATGTIFFVTSSGIYPSLQNPTTLWKNYWS